MASPIAVLCLYFSNLSCALVPAFLGFPFWNEITVLIFLQRRNLLLRQRHGANEYE